VRSLPSDREVVPPPLEPQGRCPRSRGRLDRKVVMPPVVRPLPPPPNRKVAAPGRETASIARSPAPDREVTDRDGRSFSGEPWGRLLSSRSEPPTGAVLLELWGHAVQHVRARDPQRLATRRMAYPLCDRCTAAHGSALQCDCYGQRVRRRLRLADHVYMSSYYGRIAHSLLQCCAREHVLVLDVCTSCMM
jgi:hypothetical protein